MQGFLFILLIGCIIAFIGHRLNGNGTPTETQNGNEVELAVISIETAAERKHPNWKIEKPYSHKYVLYI